MSDIVKYICPTKTIAFELVEKISNAGGNVCMVMSGNEPTRCLLSDYDCAKICALGVISKRAEDWDIQYFNKAMK